MPRFQPAFPCLSNLLLVAAIAALGACSTQHPVFEQDQLLNSATNEYSRSFNYGHADACEASRRALLSQGYMTTITHDDTVDATKNFQPTNDSHIVVEVHVVCTAGDAANTSVVYVNAIQNGYALKKSDTSASVGLSIIGSVSVPIRSNSDAMVKVSSETIQSSAFYKRFFELVSHYLTESPHTQPVPTTTGLIEVTPLPPVVADQAAAPAVVTTAAPVPVLPGTAMPVPVVAKAVAASAAAGSSTTPALAHAATDAKAIEAVSATTAATPAAATVTTQ